MASGHPPADATRAQRFYAELFGWKVKADPGLGGYALVDTGAGVDAIGGGIGPSMAPGDTGTKIYLRVDDRRLVAGAAVLLRAGPGQAGDHRAAR